MLEVESLSFVDDKPVFDNPDPYTVRFRVKPILVLDPESAVPIRDERVCRTLTITNQGCPVGSGMTPVQVVKNLTSSGLPRYTGRETGIDAFHKGPLRHPNLRRDGSKIPLREGTLQSSWSEIRWACDYRPCPLDRVHQPIDSAKR